MEADTLDSVGEVPSSQLDVVYPSGKTVNLGQELTPTEVKDEPSVKWEASADKYYTLIMYDPDAPSRMDQSYADVKHWLVVNIEGNDLSTGELIAEYIGSGAPQGSGFHRYIFLVFQQPDKLSFDEEPKSIGKLSREHRIKWSMKEFKKKYKLGKAYAGNYFKAQWDPYVDQRKKEWEAKLQQN